MTLHKDTECIFLPTMCDQFAVMQNKSCFFTVHNGTFENIADNWFHNALQYIFPSNFAEK